MNQTRFQELFSRYYNKTASNAERDELMQMINNASPEQINEAIRENGELLTSYDFRLSPEKEMEIIQSIIGKTQVKKILWKKLAIAASLLIFITFGAYYFFKPSQSDQAINQATAISVQPGDANPGTYKAKLKLADGSVIILDSTSIGKLAQQGSTEIQAKVGELVYNNTSKNNPGEIIMNTVMTSNGETYSLVLADGSKVWLNAASSVSFPVTFSGKERKIIITGEAYFEVAKNAKQPFIVSVRDLEVKALGTEFNINAYEDEMFMNTTLVNGSVQVSRKLMDAESEKVVIKPGQQAQLSKTNMTIQSIDPAKVIAWKTGWFDFESAGLEVILRQFARWYDVAVIYEGPVVDRKFFGIVKRSKKLIDVLEMLKDNNIKFRVEGRKLFVISG